MKNWAMIAIFLAVMVFSAAAQQPLKSQSAIINPGEPSTIASEKALLPALSGAPKSPESAAHARSQKADGGFDGIST